MEEELLVKDKSYNVINKKKVIKMISIKPHTIKEAPCPKCGQASESAFISNYSGADMKTSVVTETEEDGSSTKHRALSFDWGYLKVNYCHKCGYNLSGKKNNVRCLLCAGQSTKLESGIFKSVSLDTINTGGGMFGARKKVIKFENFDDEANFPVSYCPICGKRT